VSSDRMMAGSATSSSRMRDEPWWPHNAAPSTRREVSAAGRRPASPAAGSGFGVRSSQIPPSAVAAIRYRSSSWGASPCQDCAETCRASPSDRARSYSCQIGSRRDTALNSSTASRISRWLPWPCAA